MISMTPALKLVLLIMLSTCVIGASAVLADDTTTVVTVGTPGPDIAVTSPTYNSNISITNIAITVTSETAIIISNITIASTTTAGYQDFICSQTSSVQVDCTIIVTTSGDLVISAIDNTGTTTSTTTYTITLSSSTSSAGSTSATSSASSSSGGSSAASSDTSSTASSSPTSSESTSSSSSTAGASIPVDSTANASQLNREQIALIILCSGSGLTFTPLAITLLRSSKLLGLLSRIKQVI